MHPPDADRYCVRMKKPPRDTLCEMTISNSFGGIPCMASQVYPNDVTDMERELHSPLIPPAQPWHLLRGLE